ncbi:hypothetical protein BSL78_20526 [Apostichopus japonicus]|uniref:Uncharacterized protein n=1 Tax=Stichopus japonicus TaxID=307972 RepID=A0A2G8K3P2_STIJA|nr:hypothetical protein BSL78_20526 [Apostichopus japonicus]
MGQSHTHYDNLPAGEHSVLPVDGHSHSPKGLEYSLLVTESSVNTELLSRQRNNLQAVYPLVAKFYNDGYTLNQLKRIPCVKFDNKTLFQVILSKSADLLGPSLTNKWQLHVKRSFISTEHSNSTITTHVTELWRDIQEEASRGARLVSIEPTIPAAHHQDDLEKGSWGIGRPLPAEGWKLVEILFDSSVRHRGERHLWNGIIEGRIEREEEGGGRRRSVLKFTNSVKKAYGKVHLCRHQCITCELETRNDSPSRTLTMNSVWVFEKRAEDESNPSPRWEGVIIRYMHKSYTRFEDFRECYAKTSWNKVIHTMGKRGWELACIVTTPPSIQKGSLVTSINCKILMFFQRPFTGSKPLRRMSSNTQGTVISPIRVDGNAFPEWSILGESHLEEGRPVILPPYSERGVDIGPWNPPPTDL